MASSIQGEIVRTKRIGETTFANLSLIHFLSKYSKYGTAEDKESNCWRRDSEVLKKKSSDVLKFKPDTSTEELLKTNYSSVVCHSSVLTEDLFHRLCISVVYYFNVSFCFMYKFQDCNLLQLVSELAFWQGSCICKVYK